MAKPEQSKFKYLLSPENTYIIDYGEFTYEISGAEVMEIVRQSKYLDDLLANEDKPSGLI